MEILKLVREFVCDSTKAVMEDIDGKKSWAIEGIGIQMGIKNANERIYVPEPMLEQLQDHYKNYMLQNRAVGELNHPDEPKDQIRINPERISHKFTEMKIDGNNVYLKAKPVAGNKCGDVVINLLNAEIKLGFSSRALAKLIKKSDYTETHCRKIISLSDVVWDPSAPDAMITSVLEGKDWVYQNGVIMEATGFEEVVESVKDQFKKMNKYNKNQVVIKAFKEYFGALLKK